MDNVGQTTGTESSAKLKTDKHSLSLRDKSSTRSKVAPPPPWKYKSGPGYSELSPDSKSESSSSSKKWIFVTIFLLIVSNSLTAGYFIIKNKIQSINNPSTGELSKQTGLFNYSGAINQANDTRRKADLVSIGTAINVYYAEFDFPEGFPTKKQCIGTSAGCYNLAAILVPDYMREMPMDPKIGSQVNTGYSIYFDEKQEGFVMEASGEDTPLITIVR
jgi:hypothetical protein